MLETLLVSGDYNCLNLYLRLFKYTKIFKNFPNNKILILNTKGFCSRSFKVFVTMNFYGDILWGKCYKNFMGEML